MYCKSLLVFEIDMRSSSCCPEAATPRSEPRGDLHTITARNRKNNGPQRSVQQVVQATATLKQGNAGAVTVGKVFKISDTVTFAAACSLVCGALLSYLSQFSTDLKHLAAAFDSFVPFCCNQSPRVGVSDAQGHTVVAGDWDHASFSLSLA